MKLDKKYLLNYVISTVFIIIAVIFFYNLSAKTFGFDLLKPKHIYRLFKIITTGKIFTNLKNFSVFISFVGFIFVLVGGFKLSMDIEYQKDDKKEENKNPENTNEKANTNFTVATEKIDDKTQENLNENTEQKNLETEKEKEQENKFKMYDTPKKEEGIDKNTKTEIIEPQTKTIEETVNLQPQATEQQQKEPENIIINEEQERERLKNKIKEMINKIDSNEIKNNEKTQETENSESQKLLSKFDISKIKDKESTNKTENEKTEILTAEKITDKMNYKTITEEQNTIFENALINAGFKLLSEIRIGETGIDYLGISNEKIAIIQVDTNAGKWVANEEIIGENKYPLWYSENGNKISPFYRANETVNTIKTLLKDNKIPVQGYICLTNNTIVNMDEAEEIAKNQNLKILKIQDFEGNELIDSLDEEFEENSLTEPDPKTLDEIISILEQAEIPE